MGCYTQLSMFHPETETNTEEFYSYSVARVRPNLTLYANDGAGQSLGMAYGTMYNRFYGFQNSNLLNQYYLTNTYYWDRYYVGGYQMHIPYVVEKKPRTWTRDGKSNTTNLNTTRTPHETNSSSGYSNNSNVTPNSPSNSSSTGGKRATRRN